MLRGDIRITPAGADTGAAESAEAAAQTATTPTDQGLTHEHDLPTACFATADAAQRRTALGEKHRPDLHRRQVSHDHP
ncbi:hypothetical protein [Streptomyces sp. NPDC052042]|uniref:hypothetical protein n=1 Tax=Streptomyces sp. NPDC052042 TaxID=3365683 RepID=UPI0037D87C17